MFQKGHSGDNGSDDLTPNISFHLITSNNNNAEMSASEATEMRGYDSTNNFFMFYKISKENIL